VSGTRSQGYSPAGGVLRSAAAVVIRTLLATAALFYSALFYSALFYDDESAGRSPP
jgi:hypothetical protein